jgi:hypothetical protein
MTSKQSPQQSDSAKRWLYGLILSASCLYFVAPTLLRWWTLPPAVQLQNLDCIQLLRTAVSSKNSKQLDGVKKLLAQRSDEKKLSEQEHSYFSRIVRFADKNDWAAAEDACMRFEEAQLNRQRK